MKVLFLVGALLMTGPVFSKDKGNFEERKKTILANIDKRMALLTEHKSCMQAATNREGIKACRQSHKTQMKGMRDERKAMREEKKAHRMKDKAQ
ncbi:MAG: hypothetical protein AAF203_10080 [Pseudomonadota bacterium]